MHSCSLSNFFSVHVGEYESAYIHIHSRRTKQKLKIRKNLMKTTNIAKNNNKNTKKKKHHGWCLLMMMIYLWSSVKNLKFYISLKVYINESAELAALLIYISSNGLLFLKTRIKNEKKNYSSTTTTKWKKKKNTRQKSPLLFFVCYIVLCCSILVVFSIFRVD